MPDLTVNSFYRIEDLIELVRDKKDRDSIYMIYIPASLEALEAGMIVYVGTYLTLMMTTTKSYPHIFLSWALPKGICANNSRM